MRRLDDLLNSYSSLVPSELSGRLREIWPQLHGPLHHYEASAITALFRRAGFVSDGIPYPDGNLTIYRGEPACAKEPGISWSNSRNVATKYARDYRTIADTRVMRA